MKLKIISDGTPKGTKVINPETGEVLSNVVMVNWSYMVGDSKPRAMIEIDDVESELFTTPKVVKSDNFNLPESFNSFDEDWEWFDLTDKEKVVDLLKLIEKSKEGGAQ